MIELSNTTAQTLAAGQAITFDTVVLHTGTGECHRPGTSSVKMKANGIYEIYFSGNVSNATAGGTCQLNIEIGGEIMPETTMISTSAAANDVNNVSAKTAVKNCCCDYDRLTVVNTGTTAITLNASPTFFIKRVS